jgi:acyl-coenzyme A synthetase/AMP-(fatty) acid ligase
MNFWSEQVRIGAKLRPNAFVFSDTHSQISFSILSSFVGSFQGELKRQGINPSDRVLLILPRGVASAACNTALLASEIPTLAIERANLVSSLESTITVLDPRAIIFLEADRARVLDRMPDARSLEIKMPFVSRDQVRLALRDPKKELTHPLKLGWFLQTSGSTREPRLVMIGQENLVARAQGEVRDFKLSGTDLIINTLSFTHDVGFNQLLATLASHSSLRIQNQPFASALLPFLRSGSPSGISATPLLWKQVMAISKDKFTGFRYVAVSGGSLAPSELHRLSEMFPGAEVIRTYGQTETFRSLLNRSNDFETLGTPIDGVQLQLTPEGQLIHFGDGEMMGYFEAPKASIEKLMNPGVRTGDTFEIVGGGRYKFVGRQDDMIKRFDVRMHLSEVEQALSGIPDVTAVAVITKPADEGDPRENLLAAFITISPNSEISTDVILAAAKRTLDSSKQPDLMEVLAEMPMTPSYKIDRSKLKRIWEQLDGKARTGPTSGTGL